LATLRTATLVGNTTASLLLDGQTHKFIGGGWPNAGKQIEVVLVFDSAKLMAQAHAGDATAAFGLCLNVPSTNASSCPVRLALAMEKQKNDNQNAYQSGEIGPQMVSINLTMSHDEQWGPR
jgi:hypothetical protein